MNTALIVLVALWAWPIIGISIGLAFATRKTKNDNQVIQLIGLCLGFLSGIVLGPFAIYLFIEDKKGRDSMSGRGQHS